MFATTADRQPRPVAARRRAVAAATAQTLEEAYEARLLAEVARWDDQAAFETLYAAHAAAVTRAALLICHDSGIAEDITQQTFTALWVRAERLAVKSLRLRPWLCTVARNAAIDYLRSGNVVSTTLGAVAQSPSSEPSPVEAAIMSEAVVHLHAALATLPADQRDAVKRIYFRDMSYAEAAEATGEPIGTIKSRVHRAMGLLRARVTL